MAAKQEEALSLVPFGDRVVVKRMDADNVSAGGIIVPDVAKEKPRKGRIISVGPGKMLADGTRAKMEAKPGDRIVFLSYAGQDVSFGKDHYMIMAEADILARVDGFKD